MAKKLISVAVPPQARVGKRFSCTIALKDRVKGKKLEHVLLAAEATAGSPSSYIRLPGKVEIHGGNAHYTFFIPILEPTPASVMLRIVATVRLSATDVEVKKSGGFVIVA
jgi:hypothetical protein